VGGCLPEVQSGCNAPIPIPDQKLKGDLVERSRRNEGSVFSLGLSAGKGKGGAVHPISESTKRDWVMLGRTSYTHGRDTLSTGKGNRLSKKDRKVKNIVRWVESKSS